MKVLIVARYPAFGLFPPIDENVLSNLCKRLRQQGSSLFVPSDHWNTEAVALF